MDVGQPNFRFTLDDPEKKSKAIRYPMCSELHVSSLDRFNSTPTMSQTLAQLSGDTTSLPGTYNYSASQCVIQTQKALLYGYFNRLAMTEMQLFMKVPTVIEYNSANLYGNNIFYLAIYPGGFANPVQYQVYSLPGGYYTPVLLAAALQATIRGTAGPLTNASLLTVTPPTNQVSAAPTTGIIQTGFLFNTNNTDAITFAPPVTSLIVPIQTAIWKTYRLLGTNKLSFTGNSVGAFPGPIIQTYSPNFLPTDYVDVVSKALTNYKDTKDTNSSEAAPVGVLGRIYLTDIPNLPSAITDGFIDPNIVGSGPFAFTKKWAIPNWSQWSPNQAVNQIDITLLDMWGNPLFWTNAYGCGSTEWQMTLVASE